MKPENQQDHQSGSEPHDAAGLDDLARVTLTAPHDGIFAAARADAAGDPVWRGRKIAECFELCALASIAERLSILELHTDADLTAVVRLRMPVPCFFGAEQPSNGDLVIASDAVLGIHYPRDVMLRSLPGTSFVQVLRPRGTFVPNVRAGAVQVVCLGDRLPVGIRLVELILMSYRALVLQEHTLDERDPAGIFRPEAARYFQANTHWIPLTDEPFLAPPMPTVEDLAARSAGEPNKERGPEGTAAEAAS